MRVNSDFRKTAVKDVKYVKKPNTANALPENILNAIDKLEKTVAGTRLVYEILCEYLHPHVGDLWGTTLLWARPHPMIEVDLLQLAIVPRLHDFKVFVSDIPDRVPEGDAGSSRRDDYASIATGLSSARNRSGDVSRSVAPWTIFRA